MYVATPTSKHLDHLQCTGQTQGEAFNALVVACIRHDSDIFYSSPFYALIYEDPCDDTVRPKVDIDVLENIANTLSPFDKPVEFDEVQGLRVDGVEVQVRRLVLGGG